MGVPIYQHKPDRCPAGHYLVPPNVLLSWEPCDCPAALAEDNVSRGHRMILCIPCEEDDGRKTRYYEPPHSGDDVRVPRAWIRREGPGNWVSAPIPPERPEPQPAPR